jgi:hypothetical protein
MGRVQPTPEARRLFDQVEQVHQGFCGSIICGGVARARHWRDACRCQPERVSGFGSGGDRAFSPTASRHADRVRDTADPRHRDQGRRQPRRSRHFHTAGRGSEYRLRPDHGRAPYGRFVPRPPAGAEERNFTGRSGTLPAHILWARRPMASMSNALCRRANRRYASIPSSGSPLWHALWSRPARASPSWTNSSYAGRPSDISRRGRSCR